jgi:phosphate starvation-inducible PhoH-like protein
LKTPTASQPLYFTPEPLDNRRLAHLCGPMDENLRQISAALDVTIFRRGEKFIVGGRNADRALAILEQFYAIADKVVSIEDVQLALVEQRAGMAPPEVVALPIVGRARRKPASLATALPTEVATTPSADEPVLKTRRSDLRGRTPHQLAYIKAIVEHDVTFGIGPAGTGKTYLAVACAVDALERDAVRPSKRASAWASCRATCRRKSIRTCARSTMRYTICSASTAPRRCSNGRRSRSRRWPTCAAAP